MPKIWVDAQGRVKFPKKVLELLGIKFKNYAFYDISDKTLIFKLKGGEKY